MPDTTVGTEPHSLHEPASLPAIIADNAANIPASQPVGSLPAAERATLLDALNSGNLRQLKNHLALLQASRPDLHDALAPLLALAASYQLENLRQHLEHTQP